MWDLAAMQANYLVVRRHTLSTAHLTGNAQLLAQAEYVCKEAHELIGAVRDLIYLEQEDIAKARMHVRHEVADVVLATTTLAGMLPGPAVTVEACIAEKTEADRGRG